MDVFKALGNENRARIIRLLAKERMHVSGIARELGISAPVSLRHLRVLEEQGFVERERIGSQHFFSLNEEAARRVQKVWSLFERPLTVEVSKGESMLEALRKVPGIKFSHNENGAFITEVDGKKGYYLYEVNGVLPKESADKLALSKSVNVELKLLQPVIGKKISIKVR